MLHPIALHPDVQAAVREVLADGTWCNYQGWATDKLATQLTQYFQQSNVRLCSSGTIATELALRGLQVGPGDEVMLSAYDFPGNFRAIEAVGAHPVLLDTENLNWVVNPDRIMQSYSKKCKAIIVSHLHGHNTAMRQILSVATDLQLQVIEDVCQAPGAALEGTRLGSFGHCSTLSFGGSKLLSSGRGGAVLTSDPRVAQRIKVHCERGNDAYPLSQLQAAALLPQLGLLAEWNRSRNAIVNSLDDRFRNRFSWLHIPDRGKYEEAAFYKWSFLVAPAARAMLVRLLNEAGIPAGEGFPGFHRRSEDRCSKPLPLPNSSDIVERTVLVEHQCLFRADLTEDLERVFDSCHKVCHENSAN